MVSVGGNTGTRMGGSQGQADRVAHVSKGGFWSRLLMPTPFICLLVTLAFLLRVTIAIAAEQLLYAAGSGGFLGADDVSYDRVAWKLAQQWHGTGTGIHPSELYLVNLYTYLSAVVYFVFGHYPLAVKALNCFFGAVTVAIIYLTTQRIFGQGAAYVSAVAAAFYPSAVLWSAFHLKDALFLVLMAMFMWTLALLLETKRVWLALPLVLLVGMVGNLRIYVQIFLLGLAVVAVLIQRRRTFPRQWRTAALILCACLPVVWYSGAAIWTLSYVPFLNYQRYASAAGARSAFVEVAPAATTPTTAEGAPAATTPTTSETSRGDTSPISAILPIGGTTNATAANTTVPAVPTGRASIGSLLTWLPFGLIYSLALPFPWDAQRVSERLLIPDMLLWYCALILAVTAIIAHRREWRRYVHILSYIGVIWLLFAIGQGNAGTLIRQRGMMMSSFVFIFSGAGAAWLWSRWYTVRRHGAVRTPMQPGIPERR